MLIPHNLRRENPSWLNALPQFVASAVGRWGLDVGTPFHPGGYSSWVAPATDARGRHRVLKITGNDRESHAQARLLELLEGRGAVRLLDNFEFDDVLVMLLDRVSPGTALTDAEEDEEARDPVVAALLRRLWRTDTLGTSFPVLAERAADSVAELRSNPRTNLDPGLSVAAADVLEHLVATSTDEVILGGDVHTDNILLSDDGWVLIDPAPEIGDRHHDLITHILNCARLRTDPFSLIRRLAGLCDVDADRLRRWTFVACVEVSEDWTDLADIAPLLAP